MDRALGWLAQQPPGEAALEAAAAAGLDTARWPPGRPLYGAVAVPENGPDAAGPLRELLAVVETGYDPTKYRDPVRGEVDLVAQLEANSAAALAARSDAVQSFQILATAAIGFRASGQQLSVFANTTALLAQELAQKQLPDGGWGCGASASSPDCTGFAVAALAAAGQPPEPGPVVAYLGGAVNPDGGWPLVPDGQSSTQSTAWAIAAYRGLGLEPPQQAWAFLLGQQQEDGRFTCWADGAPCAEVLATSEAVVAMAGSHPIAVVPRGAPPAPAGPSGNPVLALALVGLAVALMVIGRWRR